MSDFSTGRTVFTVFDFIVSDDRFLHLWQILSGRNGTNVEGLSQTAVLVSHSCPAGSRSHWTAVSNSGLLLHISSGVVLINVILKSWTSSPQSDVLSSCLHVASVVGLHRSVVWISWLTVCRWSSACLICSACHTEACCSVHVCRTSSWCCSSSSSSSR